MKKQLISTVALPALAIFAWTAAATDARADVTVLATITKNVTLTVNEFISKSKYLEINVEYLPSFDSAAESMAVVNAVNEDNVVIGYDGNGPLLGNNIERDPLADFDITYVSRVIGSINGNSGIAGVNVDAGNHVNQGNVVSFAIIGDDGTDDGSVAHTQAELEQKNLNNEVFDSEYLDGTLPDGPFVPNKVALIRDSVNGNTGIVGVNVNSGNTTNQHNVVAMSVGIDAAVALSEAALGQSNSGNMVTEIETVKHATVAGSFNGNSGITSGNVNTGNHNNQATVVSFSALTSNAVVGVPGS